MSLGSVISNEEVITRLLTVIVATVSIISMAAFSPVGALQLGFFKDDGDWINRVWGLGEKYSKRFNPAQVRRICC
jgi:hypothetical protein